MNYNLKFDNPPPLDPSDSQNLWTYIVLPTIFWDKNFLRTQNLFWIWIFFQTKIFLGPKSILDMNIFSDLKFWDSNSFGPQIFSGPNSFFRLNIFFTRIFYRNFFWSNNFWPQFFFFFFLDRTQKYFWHSQPCLVNILGNP